MQAEMSSIHTARRHEIQRFRSAIADLAASIGRKTQLGEVASPRAKSLVQFHGVLMRECDVQDAVDEVNERIRKCGGVSGRLSPRGNERQDWHGGVDGAVFGSVEVAARQGEDGEGIGEGGWEEG